MEISNEIFFHIHRENIHSSSWIVGGVIKGESININNFFNEFRTNCTRHNDSSGFVPMRKAIKKFKKSKKEYKLNNFEKLVDSCSRSINYQTVLIRELCFENIRLIKYPNLPSRFNCIWVCREQAVEQWWSRLSADGSKCKIFKLKITGKAHSGDREFLLNDTVRLEDVEKQAYNYWNGIIKSDYSNEDILFKGDIEILSEYSSLDHLIKERIVISK